MWSPASIAQEMMLLRIARPRFTVPFDAPSARRARMNSRIAQAVIWSRVIPPK